MTLTDLRYLVAVGNTRNISRAAQQCQASQSTLSIAIRKTELELGATLFERRGREIVPTEIGERILERAETVIELTRYISTIAASNQDPLAGPVRIGVIQTVAPYLLPMLIKRVITEMPQMSLLLSEDYKSALTNQVQAATIDAAIISEPFMGPNLAGATLYEEPFVVAVPSRHPWSERDSVQAQALATQTTLLLGPNHCMHEQVMNICPSLKPFQLPGKAFASRFEGSSIAVLRHMVATGLGITVLPTSAATASKAAGEPIQIVPFSQPGPSRRIGLVWRKSYPRLNAIDALIDIIRRVAEELLPQTE